MVSSSCPVAAVPSVGGPRPLAVASDSVQDHPSSSARVSSITCSPSRSSALRWQVSSSCSMSAHSPFALSSCRATTGTEAVEETSSETSEGKPSPASAVVGGCSGCGKPESEKVGGCNGEGRIQGGIGALPGFGWWPIKAFRPCPAFIEAGGRYRRTGQSLEEVAFGRKGFDDDLDISERFKGQK